MFNELANLNNETLIVVSHAIFAEWNSHFIVKERLPKKLKEIVSSFIKRYSEDEYKELLDEYINKRINDEISIESSKAGQEFLDKLSESNYSIPINNRKKRENSRKYTNTARSRKNSLFPVHRSRMKSIKVRGRRRYRWIEKNTLKRCSRSSMSNQRRSANYTRPSKARIGS